ncbi:MAG TPA: phosphoenolpyruvate--protein phosphotransferase [Solirubrobacteraceae bacterium]|nr:phosphoenolpyruvate--protein phosphotransferase [Solirubrobacteraceae bacterium]
MVGIVLVSHSSALAEGAVALAREMGGAEVRIEAAGGTDVPGQLGTDAERVRAAVERAMSSDGVLVLMDLGSALMSAEFAVELLEAGGDRVRLSAAPLVEGAVAAAAAAAGGASLDEVAAQARDALRMKASQLEEAEPGRAPLALAGAAGPPDAEAVIPVRNAIGLHARPAARVTALARRYDARVLVARAPDEPRVAATNFTDVVALGVRWGDALRVAARGADAAAAVQALQALARDGFGEGVASAPAAASSSASATVVAAPAPAPAAVPGPGAILTGIGASPGLATGGAHHLRRAGILEPPPRRSPDPPERERERLQQAIGVAQAAIEHDRDELAARADRADADILDVQLALLGDEALLTRADQAIAGGAAAETAWYESTREVAEVYRALEEPLLRERAADVLDAGRRVLLALPGAPAEGEPPSGIVLASELAPGDAARLDPSRVTGIATAHGAATAHAAILARALGIPVVVGLGEALLSVPDAAGLLLDGDAGTVMVEPPPAAAREAQKIAARRAGWRAQARRRAHEPGGTRDGTRIEVLANLGAVAEAAAAVAAGAEGVGLLRTEFLYLERAELPDEAEQVATLRSVSAAMAGRPVIVRALDAGADKPLPAVPMPAEANPFLGVRGIRLALAHPELLATQLRAVLRVATEFPVKVMLPMVATGAELREARSMLDQARADTGIDAPLELGIMVEVPAAAVTADRLAAAADFFSIGTNDLTQYTMAAERGDERLAAHLAGCQPAVLRLVAQTVAGAATRGRPVGVCGELAGDPAAAILLVGLGVTELSMAPALIPEVKAALRSVDLADARAAAAAALEAGSAAEARAVAARLLPDPS